VSDEVKADVGAAIAAIADIKGYKRYMGKNDLASFYTSSADATAAQDTMFEIMGSEIRASLSQACPFLRPVVGWSWEGQMDNHNYKIKVEYGVSAVVFLIGVWFVFQAFTIETSKESVGPRTLPLIIAVALLLGGVWLALRAYTGKAGDLKEGYGFLESDVQRIFSVIGCGALFVALFWAFGYFTALVFTFIAMLYTFGVRNLLVMIVGAIILAIAFQALFMGVMLLNDPKGAILDLRPYTNWITGAQ